MLPTLKNEEWKLDLLSQGELEIEGKESIELELDHVRILYNQLPREAQKLYQSAHAINSFNFNI